MWTAAVVVVLVLLGEMIQMSFTTDHEVIGALPSDRSYYRLTVGIHVGGFPRGKLRSDP